MTAAARDHHQSRQPAADQPAEAVLLLSAADLRGLLTPGDCRAALAQAYAALHEDRASAGQSVGFRAAAGSFHVKAALLPGTRAVFAAKINANFPGNPAATGRPTIQGLVLVASATDGRPLAILDSAELTALRTAAATALAATHGARPDSATALVVGCGRQAPYQVEALCAVLPLRHLLLRDIEPARAERLARLLAPRLRCDIVPEGGLAAAALQSDVIVAATTATAPYLTADMVRPGSFVAAIGADSAQKHEVAPGLLAASRTIVDDLEQCAAGGDLAHAIRAGAMQPGAVIADLAALAAGAARARLADSDIVVFDSTGSGVQDVAVAAAAHAQASARGVGWRFAFA
ncbi:MAG: ornithine cyclodeaminase family protein [Alphaproteobacteria bacterium]|nr:ornithine cyclodeaminase family protein [Alphaproteobacteria bacterium]